jgi:hypothetical protein
MAYDFDTIRTRLDGVAPTGDGGVASDAGGPGPWLQESWQDPAKFWRALTAHHAALSSPAPKSHPSEGFDFYYDLVLRHRPERTAMRSYLGHGRWQSLSYGELDARSTGQVQDWTQRGLAPGAKVCLLFPVGEELLVALMTALRLGLTISYLPPQAGKWVARRLAALQPARVVTNRLYLPLAAGHQTLLLGDAQTAPSQARRLLYTYPPEATVASFFSEHVDPPEVPLPLRASELYLGALRDGLLMLSLRAGDAIATAGLSPLAHQPTLLLATLLCGATFVHVDGAELSADPSILANLPLRSVGVSAALRDRLLATHAGATRGWGHWFRNPEEPFDWQAWQRFVRQLQLENIPCSNLLFDAASGGSVLWSLRRRGQAHLEVSPAAGRPWSLRAITGTGAGTGSAGGADAPEATGDYGLLAARAPTRPPYIVLVRGGAEMIYGGTHGKRSGGRVYPAREVVQAVKSAPSLLGAAIVDDGVTRLGQSLRTLVAFTGAARPGAPVERALKDQIAQAVGPELVPDRVQLVPLFPRLRDGQVDQRWCETQQLTAMLHHKPRIPFFQLLTLLRHALLLLAKGSR